MHYRLLLCASCLVVALTVAGLLAPAAAGQPAATLTPAPAATSASSSATPASAAPAPTAAPTPEPTLTLPQAIDRVASGEKPVETLFTLLGQRPLPLVVGLVVLALVAYALYDLFRRWAKRGIDAVDRGTGGEGRDIEDEVRREEDKQAIADRRSRERTTAQALSGHDIYLRSLEADMLRLAKIPALGREQRELDLEQVYIPLFVVERDQMESFARYTLGAFDNADETRTRSGAYEAIEQSRPVFRLLSEHDQLPTPNSEQHSEHDPRITPRRRGAQRAEEQSTTERLLLVGRAGSGKTTTLHYGALVLARARRNNNPIEVRTNLHLFTRAPLFPVYARLTELMTYVHEHHAQQPDKLVGAPGQLLLDALDELARRDVPDLPAGTLSDRVKAGGCLVMLDGLDETGDASERGAAMDLIANLVHDCPQNRFLVASRPFEGLGDRLAGFAERHLRPLDADDIRRLLNKLFLALRLPDERDARAAGEAGALVPEAAELWRNLERSPRLFDMATNPLLLTSMAVLVEGREPLPVERAKIYEKLVRLTIEAWRKVQLSRDRPGVAVKLFEESDDSVRLRLQYLAADMLEHERREVTLDQARALLRPIYRANNPEWNDERCDDYVRDLLYQIALHSGLLQARDSDSLFSFTHFTLQEYLAARHYTEQGNAKEGNVSALVERWPDARWRETLLLAIGHEATSGSRENAQAMLDRLIATHAAPALLLAGDALDEANARSVGELTRQRLAVCERLRVLAALTSDWPAAANPDPAVRNRAATLLDRLDADTQRDGLDLSKPDYWAARIEPGPFSMGDSNGKYNDEKPQFDYTIQQPYALARFPITNRQYLLFMEALAGRGAPEALAAAQKLLPLLAKHGQTPEQLQPAFWPGERYRAGEGNHPVVGITWYVATAFAHWADEWLRALGAIGQNEHVRLPTEAEWERAAAYPAVLQEGDNTRAGRREYPWGDWPDLTQTAPRSIRGSVPANIDESHIGGTSAVGIFPHGAAACGAEELAGNVLEWCSTPPAQYPFLQEVVAETLYIVNKRSGSSYVLRGGSWYVNRADARCAYRDVVNPDLHIVNFGVRLARLFSSVSS